LSLRAHPSPEDSDQTRACISAIVSTASPSTAARTSTSRERAARREASFDTIVETYRVPTPVAVRRGIDEE